MHPLKGSLNKCTSFSDPNLGIGTYHALIVPCHLVYNLLLFTVLVLLVVRVFCRFPSCWRYRGAYAKECYYSDCFLKPDDRRIKRNKKHPDCPAAEHQAAPITCTPTVKHLSDISSTASTQPLGKLLRKFYSRGLRQGTQSQRRSRHCLQAARPVKEQFPTLSYADFYQYWNDLVRYDNSILAIDLRVRNVVVLL